MGKEVDEGDGKEGKSWILPCLGLRLHFDLDLVLDLDEYTSLWPRRAAFPGYHYHARADTKSGPRRTESSTRHHANITKRCARAAEYYRWHQPSSARLSRNGTQASSICLWESYQPLFSQSSECRGSSDDVSPYCAACHWGRDSASIIPLDYLLDLKDGRRIWTERFLFQAFWHHSFLPLARAIGMKRAMTLFWVPYPPGEVSMMSFRNITDHR